VVAVGAFGIHLKFADEKQRAKVIDLIARHKASDQPYIERCQATAVAVSQAFVRAIDGRRISVTDLFDQDYTEIAGTDPLQVMTKFTDLTDEIIPPIIESIVEADPSVSFCAPVDRNGYLPTHNKRYSQPQRRSDSVWNMANCRNRRIFADPAGIAAALNRQPILVQTYMRDMGGGKSVLLKEFDAPIPVHGKHWGGLRLAIKPDSHE
jgi:methyl-accepting chemotaxis protein